MEIAHLIDHTILKADCHIDDVKRTCEEAVEHGFAAVCVPPFYVKDAGSHLVDSGVKIATVVGFPFGYEPSASKVETIKRAIEEGASELDVVINLCALKNGNWNYISNELESLTMACHMRGKIVKVIIETGLLNEEEVLKVCEICAKLEVDFVKTSTGFNGQGATLEAVQLLRANLPKSIKVKASGGIRERVFAEQLIEAGADRIGTSSGVRLIKD